MDSGNEAGQNVRHACTCSLVPRLHPPAFNHFAIKSWGVEPGNEAMYMYMYAYMILES